MYLHVCVGMGVGKKCMYTDMTRTTHNYPNAPLRQQHLLVVVEFLHVHATQYP